MSKFLKKGRFIDGKAVFLKPGVYTVYCHSKVRIQSKLNNQFPINYRKLVVRCFFISLLKRQSMS